jgi:hypothetical protein
VNDSIEAETLGTSAAGALLGGVAGALWGAPRLGAAAGAVHGWMAGRRRVYERNRRGAAAFLLDHTWALPTTIASTVMLTVSEWRRRVGGVDPGFVDSLSRRSNRFVFRRGLVLRRGFALTVGTVVTGAGGADGEITERREQLVTRHEDVHVWQARLLGPLYPILYASWFIGGVLVAVAQRVTRRTNTTLSDEIDRYAYYRNPFEWHAYTCDDNWPPPFTDAHGVWSKRFPLREWIPPMFRESSENQVGRR